MLMLPTRNRRTIRLLDKLFSILTAPRFGDHPRADSSLRTQPTASPGKPIDHFEVMKKRYIWTRRVTAVLFILLSPGMMQMKAQIYAPAAGASGILTPAPPPEPRIHGAKVFGVRPGSPFLFTIPATGRRPIVFSAQGLPDGLHLNKSSGHIDGEITNTGTYTVTLGATNSYGSDHSQFRIIVGNTISLTPPMGWNSWNAFGHDVTAKDVYANARAMVTTELINHGWSYINIDDGWQSAARGGTYNAILPNKKFPDMQRLADYVHSLGLKIGIYSSPWVSAYGGLLHQYAGESADYPDGGFRKPITEKDCHRIGRYKFEWADVQQWTQWGMDYLKYDWSPNDIPSVKRMREAIRRSHRDILYSISNGAPLRSAADYMHYVNCVRTTVDLIDTWDRGNSNGHGGPQGVVDIWRHHPKWRRFSGPGHWADPDMLVVGWVGKPWPNSDRVSRTTRLTPDEQYTHLTLWCLWSAPLIMGCDLTKLDDFTLNLLSNDEVLEVDQDPLGKMASLISRLGPGQVWAKDLEDGSKAVGLFNLSTQPSVVEVKWSDLGIAGEYAVRDLWRQKNIGAYENRFQARVPGHGVILVKLDRPGIDPKRGFRSSIRGKD